MNLKNTLKNFFYSITINELRLMNNKALNPDITYNSLLYLDIISYTDNCTVSYLAETLNISKSAVTIKVNELIKQGLLIKNQSSKDKRVYYLSINKPLAQTYSIYDKSMHNAIEFAKEQYSKEEIDTFCKMLTSIGEKYLENINNGQ